MHTERHGENDKRKNPSQKGEVEQGENMQNVTQHVDAI